MTFKITDKACSRWLRTFLIKYDKVHLANLMEVEKLLMEAVRTNDSSPAGGVVGQLSLGTK